MELRGIGPFATRFTIDFDRLSVAGIYLLDGPTGSGKSTIIDAITWALYGSVAGGEDDTGQGSQNATDHVCQCNNALGIDAGVMRRLIVTAHSIHAAAKGSTG